MELWRAARLVVDTGITASAGVARRLSPGQQHAQCEYDCIKAIERYMPCRAGDCLHDWEAPYR